MNRRNFFKNLAIGAAALPAVVKVCTQPQELVLVLPEVPMQQTFTPQDLANYIADHSRVMHRAICEHVANNNPYRGLVMATDQRPLRFTS